MKLYDDKDGWEWMHGDMVFTASMLKASGVHAAAIAEYAVTMLLALAHRVPRMVEWQGRGGWPPDEQRWPLFVPTEVRGAPLGIIGYGSIGRELGRIAKTAFRMTVLACKRDPTRRADDGYCLPGTGDPEGRVPDEWLPPAGLPGLLAQSDVVVMCAPLTQETRGMLGAREFAVMKPTAYFINVGRGDTVNETALAAALGAGRLAGAAVDVFTREPPAAGHPPQEVGRGGRPRTRPCGTASAGTSVRPYATRSNRTGRAQRSRRRVPQAPTGCPSPWCGPRRAGYRT